MKERDKCCKNCEHSDFARLGKSRCKKDRRAIMPSDACDEYEEKRQTSDNDFLKSHIIIATI